MAQRAVGWRGAIGDRTLQAILILMALVAALAIGLALTTPRVQGQFHLDKQQVVYIPVSGTPMTPVILSAPSCGPELRLQAQDRLDDPDTLEAYAQQRQFLQRQGRIACIMRAADARIDDGRVVQPLRAASTYLSELPGGFWVALITGLASFVIGGWVWALRPGDSTTRLLALNGLGLMASAFGPAVYGARQLGMATGLFHALMISNHIGAHLFAITLLLLFLNFPKRLAGTRTQIAIAGPATLAMVLDISWLVGAPSVIYIIQGVEMLTILALIAGQAWITRDDPRDRAALAWLGLSVLLGAGSWSAMVAFYAFSGAGLAAMPESLIFGCFLLIYAGLALGIARFRLFELGDWAFRIFFFTAAGVLFILLDAVFVATLGWTANMATALALLIVAFGYLPLREWLWRNFWGARRMAEPEIFEAVIDIAFAPTPQTRAERWQTLLVRLFHPLRIEPLSEDTQEAVIDDDGLSMIVPAAAESQSLRLISPRGGRGLFSPSQLALVKQLVALTRTASASRDAYERGAAEERRRLAQDLHDDVGARLISGIGMADAKTRLLLHDVLGDIRAIAHELLGAAAPLDRVLADLRHEGVRRLEAAGIAVDWAPWPEDASAPMIDYAIQKALASSLRETISNILRHSGAKSVCVALSLHGGSLSVEVSDDGIGLSETALSGASAGAGLGGLQRRLNACGGQLRLGPRSDGSGTCIGFDVSLVKAEVAESRMKVSI